MQKIRMLRPMSGMLDGHPHPKAGDVLSVPKATADDLCDREDPWAERVKTTRRKKKAAKSAPETSSKEADETR